MKWLAVMFFVFIVFVFTSANLESDWLKSVSGIPYIDKAMHFLLIGGAAFFANVLLNLKTTTLFNRAFLLGSVIVFVLITFEEFSQMFIAARTFDLIDLAANYLGIWLIGSLAKYVPTSLLSTQKESSLST